MDKEWQLKCRTALDAVTAMQPTKVTIDRSGIDTETEDYVDSDGTVHGPDNPFESEDAWRRAGCPPVARIVEPATDEDLDRYFWGSEDEDDEDWLEDAHIHRGNGHHGQ